MILWVGDQVVGAFKNVLGMLDGDGDEGFTTEDDGVGLEEDVDEDEDADEEEEGDEAGSEGAEADAENEAGAEAGGG